MSHDLIQISRLSYTLLDLLADMDGLRGILISGVTFLLNIWNFNYLDDYLVSKLFR